MKKTKLKNDSETLQKSREPLSRHVFKGSTAMVGICLSAISFIITANKNTGTWADEILGVDAFLFIISALLSYLALHRNSPLLVKTADIIFFIGMTSMGVAGVHVLLG